MSNAMRHPSSSMFSGSYAPEDVTFLLKRVWMNPTPVAEKERRIQSGESHYSEMISEERRPDARYLALFEEACKFGVPRLACDVRALTVQIVDRIRAGKLNAQITLCSLVRAGVPYGVLLRRDLARAGIDVVHFGISIIRDRGLDTVAMRHVLAERPADGVIFVDGWTGKGAIAAELNQAWRGIAGTAPLLAVIADPCGRADLCASREDWLIPSGILGGSVSGLISRSILRSDLIGIGDFHGCLRLDHLADVDVSVSFVDQVDSQLCALVTAGAMDVDAGPDAKLRYRAAAEGAVEAIAKQFGIQNFNQIKPGIAEATRAVLRRRPHMVFLRDIKDPDVAALVYLCRTDGIDICADATKTGPYRAITVIERLG